MGSIIQVKELKTINVEGGDVKHFLKSNEDSFNGFGEAYFSFINKDKIKGWKLHTKMTMNLVVPIGEVGFVFFIEEKSSFEIFKIGQNNYKRLTVPPNIWFGFKGIAKKDSIILNIADILHESTEAENKNIEELNFNWSKK